MNINEIAVTLNFICMCMILCYVIYRIKARKDIKESKARAKITYTFNPLILQ